MVTVSKPYTSDESCGWSSNTQVAPGDDVERVDAAQKLAGFEDVEPLRIVRPPSRQVVDAAPAARYRESPSRWTEGPSLTPGGVPPPGRAGPHAARGSSSRR